MFCSATPALMNRDCIASRTPSSAMNPRSPVRKTERAGERYFSSASAKGFLIAAIDFPQRDPILLGAEREVVPLHGILHERDSVALYGFEDNDSRALAADMECIADGGVVVTVDGHDLDRETFELNIQRVHRRYSIGSSEPLQPVFIDHNGKIC